MRQCNNQIGNMPTIYHCFNRMRHLNIYSFLNQSQSYIVWRLRQQNLMNELSSNVKRIFDHMRMVGCFITVNETVFFFPTTSCLQSSYITSAKKIKKQVDILVVTGWAAVVSESSHIKIFLHVSVSIDLFMMCSVNNIWDLSFMVCFFF